ncbi:MAG: hypothetical protein O4861_00565 [Trichodesmium sp. St16_bin4-tuft]|nr:hypothetical protein [Trichodesmium sp. St4_bin8_1]MDE5071417.1 hypothetical protein [Trichodesmium sp. St5_bin8]MDE5078875.1 hypothetical protein [Trichodesmium sp. St2_bin6]MDE5096911.1 hypothetical protein [Trichodesmium sp. St16_bin4-tuft]
MAILYQLVSIDIMIALMMFLRSRRVTNWLKAICGDGLNFGA